jgi:hypothetical protein
MLKINLNEITDAEDFQPVAPVVKAQPLKSNWDDEDVEEDDVKESWEEEEEVRKICHIFSEHNHPLPQPHICSSSSLQKV